MKNNFRKLCITIFVIQLTFSACDSESNNMHKSDQEVIDLTQNAQIFDVYKSTYCSNPWSATSETQSNKIRLY